MLLSARLRPGVAYLAGVDAVVAFGEGGATEVCVQLPQTAADQPGDMNKLLADAFMQRFRAQGSAEVKALLPEE